MEWNWTTYGLEVQLHANPTEDIASERSNMAHGHVLLQGMKPLKKRGRTTEGRNAVKLKAIENHIM